MLEYALCAAMAVACGSALMGNRNAWVLLPFVYLCLYLDDAGYGYDRADWMAMDLCAMAIIFGINRKRDWQFWTILALFLAAWAFYLLPDPYRYSGSVSITILQLLLTFPVANAWKRIKLVRRQPDRWNEFDLRAAHGEAGG